MKMKIILALVIILETARRNEAKENTDFIIYKQILFPNIVILMFENLPRNTSFAERTSDIKHKNQTNLHIL